MRYLKFNTPFTGFPPMSRRLRLIQLLMAVAALYVLPACHAAHSRLRAGAQNPDQIFIALRAWRDFEAHYPQFALDDDPQVKCYALIPRAMRGEDIAQKAHALLRIAP